MLNVSWGERPLRSVLSLLLVLALGGLVLSGCAALAPPAGVAPQRDMPAAWSTDDGTGPGTAGRDGWWLGFGDPLLAMLVDDAMTANTSVTGAEAALRQARALRAVAAAGLLPQLGSSASATQTTSGSKSTGRLFQAGLDAAWELDVFGAGRSGVAAADANANAVEATLGDVQVSIAAEVGLAYIALRNAQARLAVGTSNLESQRETLQLTAWRTQAGLLSAVETDQAATAAAQTEALLPSLRAAALQQGHALAVLSGRPPAALDGLLGPAGPIPLPAADLALSLPAETLRQRPDVRAAEWQVVAAQGRVAQADARRFPAFKLGGSLGLSALTLGALGSGPVIGSLLAGVSLPLLDGGAARAQVQAQQAALDQALSSYRGTVLGALQEVEDALLALRSDRERLDRLSSAAASATRAATLARQRYAGGLVDFQTVLETQRSQLGAQDNQAQASADVGADHMRLFKALGGAWRPPEAPPSKLSGTPR